MDPVYASDADDDAHICLKCRLTITGLDNYVAHRKSGCYSSNRFRPVRPSDDDLVEESVRSETISPIENPSLKADDFFSLLELQSSSKKQGGEGFGTKSSAGVVTRSKASATILARDEQLLDQQRSFLTKPPPIRPEPVLGSFHPDVQNAKVLSDPNLVICNLAEGDDEEFDELKDAGCPPSKDVGKWKPGGIGVSPTPWTTPLLDEEREFSWEFSSAQDQTAGTWDPQIHSTHTGRYGRLAQSPSPTQTHKSEKSGSRVSRCSVDNPPSNKQTASEQSGAGGVKIWKTSGEPPPAMGDGRWRPQYQVHEPPVTVGGKWRPEQDDVAKSDGAKEENEHHSAMTPLPPPPPSHTRGKWAPGMESRVRAAMGLEPDADGSGQANVASPVRKSGSTVQYWCAACNRRLSSRSLYERHLLSELHFKRTLPQRGSTEITESDSLARPKRQRRRKRLDSPPPLRKPSLDPEPPIASASKTRLPEESTDRIGARCGVCGARVLGHQVGKHLVSHYHWRGMQRAMARATSKAAVEGVVRSANRMVLDNIHAVVRQAPFQCAVCRFYCNTAAAFREHWISRMHLDRESEVQGEFWCWPCDIMQGTSSDLLGHLTSPEHLEVEAALNRTLPVIVRRRRDQHCVEPGCGRSFRLNIQLRQHQRAMGHAGLLRCGACGVPKGSHLSLQKHVLRAHPVDATKDGGPAFCARTQQLFPSAAAAAAATAAAAAATAERRQHDVASSSAPRPRRCPHCDAVLPDVTALRLHLDKRHPDLKIRCARCNAAFALPQQVTRHVRDGRCAEHLRRQLQLSRQGRNAPDQPLDLMAPATEAPAAIGGSPGTAETVRAPTPLPEAGVVRVHLDDDRPKTLSCATCPYRSDSQAELLYHELLHRGSLDEFGPMRCPVQDCGKTFQRATSLRCHIRTHTGERPFRCTSCPAAFTRRYTLAAHRRRDHTPRGAPAMKPGRLPATADPQDTAKRVGDAEEWVDWRVASVIQDADVGSETQLCAVCGKCFRDRGALRHHMAVHNQKKFACTAPGCEYRAASAAKLRRHQQSHSDERPFVCDQCQFCTKSRPLLQRHMMTHTGSKPYSCPHCPFSSRMSLHLRRHLRVHTGAKPYRCPHCPYQCNVMENLRKHVMSTKQHSGKKLYVCRECGDKEGFVFSTNSAKDIQAHLMTAHAGRFATPAEASAYILAGIYQPEEDSVDDVAPNQSLQQEGEEILNIDDVVDPMAVVDHVETIETVNIVRVEQAIGSRVVVTCPDGQLMSMLVLPPDLV